MPPPDPEHLLEQASNLTALGRQADLRRAISTAYYALFHFVLTAAADMVIGADKRSSEGYRQVYRSVDHLRWRQLCSKAQENLGDVARIASNLYELRILADYDPLQEFTADEAKDAVAEAQQAIKWFRESAPERRQTFLISLLFNQR
jgi:uncharacterized protein (UPF0332 family)